jgi:flavin reductase (DIM6/NTAB) family NADH-FMN oxidoreductase RutF
VVAHAIPRDASPSTCSAGTTSGFAMRATPAGTVRFAGVDWHPGHSRIPLLTDALATLECEIVAEHPTGDHWIVVGRVDNLRTSRPSKTR